MSPIQRKEKFDDVVFKCVNRALKNIVGEVTAKLLLYRTEAVSRVKRWEEIIDDMEELFKGGVTGLEEGILREIYSELNIPYQHSDRFDFRISIQKAEEIYQ